MVTQKGGMLDLSNEDSIPTVASRETLEAVPDSDQRPAILVIDDDDLIRDVLSRLFLMEPNDIKAHVVSDTPQGIEILQKKQISLVLTDLNGPGIYPHQLIAYARERFNGCLPILAMSGQKMDRSLEGKFKHFLSKPFCASELIEVVRRYIATNVSEGEEAI